LFDGFFVFEEQMVFSRRRNGHFRVGVADGAASEFGPEGGKTGDFGVSGLGSGTGGDGEDTTTSKGHEVLSHLQFLQPDLFGDEGPVRTS
jgi:hypothetical protein